jgi:hypothetical protein
MNIFIKANKSCLLLLCLLALGLLSACSSPTPATTPPKEPLGPPDRVDVVFFYVSETCRCQEVVGESTYATVFFNFSEELANGKLTFQSLDLDDKDNAAIAYKYSATTMSLFLNIVRADTERIIPVPEILLVKDDEEALDKLVNSRIQQSLEGVE